MTMLIDNKFEIGETVFLKTDTDGKERLVTRLQIQPNRIIYCLAQANTESWHEDFEISRERVLNPATAGT